MNKVEFLQAVTSQIKNKSLRQSIYEELNHHFQQSIEALEKDGYGEAEAEEITLNRMGNPESLGAEMNKIHKPQMDWSLITAFVLLQILSALPLFLALPGQINLSTKLFQILLSFSIVLGLMFFDYRKLARFHKTYFAVCFIILGLLHFQVYTTYVNGQLFFRFLALNIDVSFILLFLLLGFSSILAKSRLNQENVVLQIGEKQLFTFRTVPGLLAIGVFIVLFLLSLPVLLLPIISMAYFVFFLLYFYTFRKQRKSVFVGLFSLIIMPSIWFIFVLFRPAGEMFRQRLLAFFTLDGYSYEFQLYGQIEYYLQNAALFGNREELLELPLPSAYTDFAFVTFVYSFGWILAVFLIGIFLFIAFRIVFISQKVSDPFGKLLSLGILVLLTFPFLYSVLMAFGIVPISSFSLPFFSYGTVSLILNACYIGLILSVYRKKDFPDRREGMS